MKFNFYPIKAEMSDEFRKVIVNRIKKLKKGIKFGLGCRKEDLSQDIYDAVFKEIDEISAHELEKIHALFIQMLSQVDAILDGHIA